MSGEWVKHKEVHYCAIPSPASASTGDRWRCDECGGVWRRNGNHPLNAAGAPCWRLTFIATWKSRRALRKAGQ